MQIHTISVGFVPSHIWFKSIAKYQSTSSKIFEYKHWFLDQHYPLDKINNSQRNKEICLTSGVNYLNAGQNLGLHGGFNYVLNHIAKTHNLLEDDIIIGYDPDSTPTTPGWDMALVSCFQDRDVVWASLMAPWLEGQLLGKTYKIDHLRVHELSHPIMNSICAFRYGFLKATHGLHEPGKWYGGLEIEMWKYIEQHKKKWVFTLDYWEDHTYHLLQDEKYKIWKWELCHKRTTTLDFESWLKLNP